MDSDDNCLIIDEGMDMEVTSTTESRAETPINGMEMGKDTNPHDGDVNILLKSTDGHTTPKQKERSGDRRKSKDDKYKSTPTPSKDRKRSLSKRAHTIRLTPAVLQEKILNVSTAIRFSFIVAIFFSSERRLSSKRNEFVLGNGTQAPIVQYAIFGKRKHVDW